MHRDLAFDFIGDSLANAYVDLFVPNGLDAEDNAADSLAEHRCADENRQEPGRKLPMCTAVGTGKGVPEATYLFFGSGT
ncbi:MAG: hypothetical protein ACR2Q4_03865 [Geminicoccaceae bacterium]